MKTRHLQRIGKPSLLLLSLTLLWGCSSGGDRKVILPPASGANHAVAQPFKKPPKVIKVNKEWQYAVVEDRNMPEKGREGEVVRNDQVVGLVQASAQRRAPFLTVNIIEGSIQRGDQIRWKLKPDWD